MKPTQLFAALAATALLITGCGSNGTQADEPEDTPVQEAQDATQDTQAQDDDHVSPTQEYHDTLDELGNPLDEDQRYRIGTQACLYMLTDAMGEGTDVFLDQIDRDNISLGNTSVSVDLSRADVKDPQANKVTRAAIEYICPEVKDKMTDDAKNHNVFREDEREELDNE